MDHCLVSCTLICVGTSDSLKVTSLTFAQNSVKAHCLMNKMDNSSAAPQSTFDFRHSISVYTLSRV